MTRSRAFALGLLLLGAAAPLRPAAAQNRLCDPRAMLGPAVEAFRAEVESGRDLAALERPVNGFAAQLYARCRGGDVLLSQRGDVALRLFFCDFTKPVQVADPSVCILVECRR